MADDLATQLIVFAVSSLLCTGTLRRLLMDRLQGGQVPGGSDHADEFEGKSVTVLTDFSGPGTMGKVEFKGAEWKARAEDELHPGDAAVIASVDGITLIVRRQWLL